MTERLTVFRGKLGQLEKARDLAAKLTLTSSEAARLGIAVRQDGVRRSARELLALPEVDVARLARIWPELGGIPSEIAEQLEIDAHYAGYLDRQEADIVAFRRDESLSLPPDLNYDAVIGLSTECRLKLAAVKPRTLGQAARIDGMTPAALTLILVQLKAGAVRRHAAG